MVRIVGLLLLCNSKGAAFDRPKTKFYQQDTEVVVLRESKSDSFENVLPTSLVAQVGKLNGGLCPSYAMSNPWRKFFLISVAEFGIVFSLSFGDGEKYLRL